MNLKKEVFIGLLGLSFIGTCSIDLGNKYNISANSVTETSTQAEYSSSCSKTDEQNKNSSLSSESSSQNATSSDQLQNSTASTSSQASSSSGDTSQLNGWVGNKYYENGQLTIGDKQIDNSWYHFDSNGNAVQGLYSYVDVNGQHKIQAYGTDFKQIRNGYYTDANGTYYFLGADGDAISGLRPYINGKGQHRLEAYTADFKQIRNGYYTDANGTYYFLGADGDAISGLRPYINGKGQHRLEAYTADFKQIRNGYYTDTNGTYYFLGADGDAISGLRPYINGKGQHRLEAYTTDFKQIRNGYYRDANGTYYFLGADGDAISGLRPYINGKGQHRLEAYTTDFKQIRNGYYRDANGTYYFLGADGDAISGLREYKKGVFEYYDTKTFKQLRNGSITINGIKYIFGSNGDGKIYNDNATKAAKIIALAKTKLGDPYTQSQAGRLGPNSFDCSGFVYYLYKNAAGITLSGNVTTTEEKLGSEVSLNALKPGDLLFYGTRGNTYHVGIYEGNGKMIHAATPKDGVCEVQIKYYMPSFARRILN